MASPSGGSEKPGSHFSHRLGGRTDSSRLTLTVTAAAEGRARVVVVGELDLDSAADLRRVLAAALQTSTGLEIDLARVSFFDCSGLHVLMDTRHESLSSGQTVAVVDTSPCVRRLLGLTGTLDFLAITTRGDANGDPLPTVHCERPATETGGRDHPRQPRSGRPLLPRGSDDV
ncbi:STAS domain-containing protein [Streptomyces sp. CA-135486]|uniref:STAS domain-containing protein n=1 Tax=Streptomyces sp. CA-135486 TaxID=3240049 RepID=UPI003D8EC043